MGSDNSARTFVREKKIHCGKNYLEVDIINYTGRQIAVTRKSRARKYRESAPKQVGLNEKNSRRYFIQLINANFTEGDYHVTCTYSGACLSESEEAAEKEARRFIRRISSASKKRGEKIKYVLVTSTVNAKSGKVARVHHHILLGGTSLSRDEIESLWKSRGKEKLGHCNCDRIDMSSGTLSSLAVYLCKQGSMRKRWTSSIGLIKPYSTLNDDKYSARELRRFASERCGDREFWQKKYPGWVICDIDYGIRCEYSDISGWGIYLKMRRADDTERLAMRGRCSYARLRKAQESCVGCPVFDLCRVYDKGI